MHFLEWKLVHGRYIWTWEITIHTLVWAKADREYGSRLKNELTWQGCRLKPPLNSSWVLPPEGQWCRIPYHLKDKEGKSEGSDSCDRPSNLAQIRSKSMKLRIFSAHVTLKFDRWPWKTIAPCFKKLCVPFGHFFGPCDLEIWWMTLNNNRALHLFYAPSSFVHHFVAVCEHRKCSIWIKIFNFSACVTLKFDGWPWKTMRHLFYTTSSSVHHFVAICEFKLELRSGNTHIGAKLVLTSVTFTFVLWPWALAWTSLLSMVITPKNFVMIQQQEHSKIGVTDGQTDRQDCSQSCFVAAKNKTKNVCRMKEENLKVSNLRKACKSVY